MSARVEGGRWRAAATWPFVALIYLYRVTLGPWLGGHCRFEPSCSRYALEAYQIHGPVRGSMLTVRRLLRCHPFGGRGFDPVPGPVRREGNAPKHTESPKHGEK